MGLFNLVTTHVRNGRPYGFNIEVRGVETVDAFFEVLLRDGIVRCDRLTFAGASGETRVVRERAPIVLGKGMIGQISLAMVPGIPPANQHGRRTIARQLPENSLRASAGR